MDRQFDGDAPLLCVNLIVVSHQFGGGCTWSFDGLLVQSYLVFSEFSGTVLDHLSVDSSRVCRFSSVIYFVYHHFSKNGPVERITIVTWVHTDSTAAEEEAPAQAPRKPAHNSPL